MGQIPLLCIETLCSSRKKNSEKGAPLPLFTNHLTYPLRALLQIWLHYTRLPLFPIFSPGSRFLPRLPARHCPLFLHSTAPGGFGAATFLLLIGVQVSAVAQWCSLGILRTCPKNLHLLLFTSILILGLCILFFR